MLVICVGLFAVPGTAEQAAVVDCTGSWYLVYVDVTIGEMTLDPDGSYLMTLYSQNNRIEGSWTQENATVTLTPRDSNPSSYTFDGVQLIPDGFNISFAIRRDPGRITDSQLNDYVASNVLPEGVSEAEMKEIIQEIYDVSDPGTEPDETFRDFDGVWTNGADGYLTIWGKNVTGAFPVSGELQTGYYGDPGEWTREGNTLINTDGTILVLKSDGSMLCSENSGTYHFTRIFEQSAVSTGAPAGKFTGDWKGIGVLIADASGTTVYAPIAGYDLKVKKDRIYTLFENTVSEYPYDVVPGSGTLSYADADNQKAAYALYQDGTLRWALSDTMTVVFRAAGKDEAVSLYTVTGPVYVPAGASAAYTVTEKIGQRTFTWSAEGDGVAIDPETGVLTVAAETAVDTPFTITAAPSDGDEAVTLAGSVCSGVSGLETSETVFLSYARGFGVPVFDSLGTPSKTEDKANSSITYHYETDGLKIDENCAFIRLEAYADAAEYYRQIAEKLKTQGTYQDLTEKTADIDGYPVYLMNFTTAVTETATETAGFIYAIRENTILVMTLVCAAEGEIPARMTVNDLETVAKQIAFDPEKAPVRKADGELSVSARGNPETLQAGKSITFTAAFANANAVKKDKADTVVWTVADPATGEAPEGITVSDKGAVSADREITEKKSFEVIASSPVFGTRASWPMTAEPVIRKLTAEQAKVVLYIESDDSADIRIHAEPDIALEEIAWTVRPSRIAEVIPGEGGTAVLKPLETGNGTLTAKEPGGKSTEIDVSVVKPVQTVELTMSGDPVPGGTVRFTADVQPKDAGRKKTEWALDVGEEIATVDENGRVRIKKETPAGTVITVTCTANGAKEPVVQSARIEVAEK